jgi:hypothetical protein
MSQDYTHMNIVLYNFFILFFSPFNFNFFFGFSFSFILLLLGCLLHAQQYDGGNVTLSQLSVQLTPDDDGQKLVCRAENSALGLASASAIEDTWLLDVYCELFSTAHNILFIFL